MSLARDSREWRHSGTSDRERKSLMYQLLPFAFDLQTDSSSSRVLVVSPLVALMVQQVERARRLGLKSAKERKATGEGLGSSSSRKDGYVWVLVETT